MDIQELAQAGIDMLNDRSFREQAKDLMDPHVLIVDISTGQELRGPDGYVQYSAGLLNAIPDLKGTVIEHKVSGNKVSTRARAGEIYRHTANPTREFPREWLSC